VWHRQNFKRNYGPLYSGKIKRTSAIRCPLFSDGGRNHVSAHSPMTDTNICATSSQHDHEILTCIILSEMEKGFYRNSPVFRDMIYATIALHSDRSPQIIDISVVRKRVYAKRIRPSKGPLDSGNDTNPSIRTKPHSWFSTCNERSKRRFGWTIPTISFPRICRISSRISIAGLCMSPTMALEFKYLYIINIKSTSI
jgi:hypothetical protein